MAGPLAPLPTIAPGLPPDPGRATGPATDAVAREFEAVFLTEMLKHAGLGEARETFSGGAGESAFAAMLAREYAEAMARAGGVGIADAVRAHLDDRGIR